MGKDGNYDLIGDFIGMFWVNALFDCFLYVLNLIVPLGVFEV